MNTYQCGQRIFVNTANIDGTITGVLIRFDTVIYEIGYFKELEYKQIWLNDCEFTVSPESKKSAIGFKNGSIPDYIQR